MLPPDVHADERYLSSGGHVLSDAGWLDDHFEACRPEYTAMLDSVGIRAGWHVLDAGCGSGSYLPLLAGHVGGGGRVCAIDVSAASVATVQERAAGWRLACPLETGVSALTSLPFPDASFDAAWCANVLQYFDDAGLRQALAELRRVVRPGGLVAVKDVDMQLMRVAPANPFLLSRLADASFHAVGADAQSRGSARGRELRRWLEAAGLVDVWQRTTLIERWSPLRPVERRFFAGWLAFLAGVARRHDLDAADVETWERLSDPGAAGPLVDDPAFYVCEGQTVAVGVVPRFA